ncbi:Blue-light-activated protein [Massilia sp. Bi118]|uniref:ATP-binding protein n=1 Tax=Massilia sp. Bi118 TaxID=2822346 RepID=UPI001DE2CA44|nr:ATP-binding protein [Massilia sp. Bi118]CAH0281355.1 Blue-light-activated protein [Massilia sp. Bi118]
MQIRTRLLLLSLSILVPAWLAAVYSVHFIYSEEKLDYNRSMLESARSLALLVDNEVQTKEAVLLALSKSPALRKGDLETFRNYAREVVPESAKAIVLTSLEGQQLVNTRATPGRQLPAVNRDLLALTRATPGQTVVSNLFVGGIAKRKDVAVDVPVFIKGELRYRLAMAVEAASFEKLLQARRSTSWLMTVVDRNGIVVARSVDSTNFAGRRATDSLFRRVAAHEESGAQEGITLEGIPVTTFLHRAPKSSWTVSISVPTEEIQEPARRAALVLTGMIVALLGIGIAVANSYGRKTAGTIESLRSAAERLGSGQRIQVPATGLKEVDVVGAALTEASGQVQRHQSELERRVREAVAATERSQRSLLQTQKLEALGRLTGGIAHDFNNILQTLTSALQLINRSTDLSTIKRLSETSQRAVGKATALTAQLRAFGRVQDVRLETVSVPYVLATVMPLLKNALPANVVLKSDSSEDGLPVTIDLLQFELALLNIVINARDAMPSGGEIRLSVTSALLDLPPSGLKPGPYIAIKISDNGSGMSPDVLSHAIDPFFTTKGLETGSGLGLAQAYGFATQAGGTLLLDSELGKGTRVLIYLPAAQDAFTTTGEPVAPAEISHGSGTVLFVEDDQLIRAAVAPGLAEAGFRVVEAADADEALRTVASGLQFDVLFSDVVMPGQINGVELARLIRARIPHMPVVLASGHTELRIDLPKVRLVGKPYDIDEVTRFLNEEIAQARSLS